MTRLSRNSLIALVALLVLALLPARLAVAGRDTSGSTPTKKPDPSGNYTATVAGCYKGTGQASATTNTISISVLNLTDENGNAGTLTASGLTVDNKNHVTGTGTATTGSSTVNLKFSGRIDAIDPAKKDGTLKTHRFVCTFSTVPPDDKTPVQHGRVVGYVDLTLIINPLGGSGGSGSSGGSGGGGTGAGGGGIGTGGGTGTGGTGTGGTGTGGGTTGGGAGNGNGNGNGGDDGGKDGGGGSGEYPPPVRR
jgi:hypothetical protein